MIRSDKAVSGVIFTLDTDSGFPDVIMINASYGLGELVVKGEVTPDEFWVHKPTLEKGFKPILKKQLGDKKFKLVYSSASGEPTKKVPVPPAEQHQFCLTEEEILELSRDAVTIEDYYSNLKGSWCPMDIEWAKDGDDQQLYIIQARPETVQSQKKSGHTSAYSFKASPSSLKDKIIVVGNSVGQAIASGIARVISSAAESSQVQKGDIIVTEMTDPDWVPALKKAAGIITNSGGRTCHAAIVSRELGIPAIVGAMVATTKIQDGQPITIDCSQGSRGFVYEGLIPFEVKEIVADPEKIKKIKTKLLLNIAQPENAFATSFFTQ